MRRAVLAADAPALDDLGAEKPAKAPRYGSIGQ
jgi:hypothetical protein